MGLCDTGPSGKMCFTYCGDGVCDCQVFRMGLSLDEIAAAAEQRKLEQQRQNVADMADEIERIKAEDWQPPFDEHEYTPETTVPADWFIRDQIAKQKATQGLAEEPKETESQAWYTIETD